VDVLFSAAPATSLGLDVGISDGMRRLVGPEQAPNETTKAHAINDLEILGIQKSYHVFLAKVKASFVPFFGDFLKVNSFGGRSLTFG